MDHPNIFKNHRKVGLIHYEVTMSGMLMANYYISWRLKTNVMSSKYLVMRVLRDH